ILFEVSAVVEGSLIEGIGPGLLGEVVADTGRHQAQYKPVHGDPVRQRALSLVRLDVAGSGRRGLAVARFQRRVDEGGELIEEVAEVRPALYGSEVLTLLGRLLEVLEDANRDHRASEPVAGDRVHRHRPLVVLSVAVQDAVADRGGQGEAARYAVSAEEGGVEDLGVVLGLIGIRGRDAGGGVEPEEPGGRREPRVARRVTADRG